MSRHPFKQGRVARLVVIAASSAALALGLCGCQTTASSDITGSLGDKAEASPSADPRRDLDAYRERYRANPKDPALALQYGRALRANGERSQAVAVLEQASIANPKNKAVLAGYGRALADNGNFQQALDVLSQAHTPEDPDWRILSAQGAVLDQLGRYDEARQYYAAALKIVPDEPSVLSNLGLSYMLSKDLRQGGRSLAPRPWPSREGPAGADESRGRAGPRRPRRRSGRHCEGRAAARGGDRESRGAEAAAGQEGSVVRAQRERTPEAARFAPIEA